MFRQLPKKLFTTFRSTNLNQSTLIAPIVKSAWYVPTRKNSFLSQRFFSTAASITIDDDFKSNFSTFLKRQIANGHDEIKEEAIKIEVKSLYETLAKGMQINKDECPDFVKIIHKEMSKIVKGHDIISISIGKFSNEALSAFYEQLDNHGYAASISWLSEEFCHGWVVNSTDIVLSFCKKISGITDREILSPILLSTEDDKKVFGQK